MNIGTKSLLFGVHQFLLHPLFVAAAWWRLYGFPWDPWLWVAFIVHDWGYWGCPNMDGPEGEQHPIVGASIMWLLTQSMQWWELCAYHSRFYARQYRARPSRLCFADKLSIIMMPTWLYLPLARATGEIKEYMRCASVMINREAGSPDSRAAQKRWHKDVQLYLWAWVNAHKDGAEDTWTPTSKQALKDSGVWK